MHESMKKFGIEIYDAAVLEKADTIIKEHFSGLAYNEALQIIGCIEEKLSYVSRINC